MADLDPNVRRRNWIVLIVLVAVAAAVYVSFMLKMIAATVDAAMNVIHELPHVLAIINAATIVVLLRAYSRIRARDREGHRRTMFVAIGLGVAFLAVYLVYHAFAGLAKFGGYGAIRPIYFTLLAIHVFMAFVVAVLVPVTFYNALRQRFATHKRLARFTFPAWLFVAVSGLVVYVMAVHLYPMNDS